MSEAQTETPVWVEWFTEPQNLRKLSLGLLGVVLTVTILGWLAPKAIEFKPLLSGVQHSRDLLRLSRVLAERQICSRIEEGGTVLAVPSHQHEDALAILVQEGIKPAEVEAESQAGFLGLPSGLGLDPSRNVDRRQAKLEASLAATIAHFPEVMFAKVHLSLPAPQRFKRLSQRERATASVFLNLVKSAPLIGSQAHSIRSMVASSIKGLSPQDVTLTDSLGSDYAEIIRRYRDELPVRRMGIRIRLLKEAEERARGKLLEHLQGVFGPKNVCVSVSAGFCAETTSAVLLPGQEPPPARPRICYDSLAISVNQNALAGEARSEEVRRVIWNVTRNALGDDSLRPEQLRIQGLAFPLGSSAKVSLRKASSKAGAGKALSIEIQKRSVSSPLLPPSRGEKPGSSFGFLLGLGFLVAGGFGVFWISREFDAHEVFGEEERDPGIDFEHLRQNFGVRREAFQCWAEEDPEFTARFLTYLVQSVQDGTSSLELSPANFLFALGPKIGPEVLSLVEVPIRRDAILAVTRHAPCSIENSIDPGLGAVNLLATRRALAVRGPAEARRLALKIETDRDAQEVLDQVDQIFSVSLPSIGDDGPRTSMTLPRGARTDQAILEKIDEIPPEGIALSLVMAPRKVARRLLVDLVERNRTDVCTWMARLEQIYPGVLEHPDEGEDILSELLDGVRHEVREKALGLLHDIDPILWERLFDRGFTIRELEDYDDLSLGRLLASAPTDDLALSLREAPEALRLRCLRLLPLGLRSLVTQQIDSTQPVRLRELERARENLGAICRDLGLRGCASGVHHRISEHDL